MKQTIIKWQAVNTRKKDKNLPKVNSIIVFKLPLSGGYKDAFPDEKEHISTSSVYQENGNLYVLYGLIRIHFPTALCGAIWMILKMYRNDVLVKLAKKWDVSDERFRKLTEAGYNYDQVQRSVNQMIYK